MKNLTSSSLGKFRDCPRRYFNCYELARVPVSEARYRSFGRLWHTAMEAWWKDGKKAALAALADNADKVKAEDAAKICAMLGHYWLNVPKEDYDVIGVEVPFEVKIENPDPGGRSFYGYRLLGKVDVLVKHRSTKYTWIIDHKTTTSEINGFGPYWQSLQIDGQMCAYCLAFNARGFIYDVARKPGIKISKVDKGNAEVHGISVEAAYQNRVDATIEAEPGKFFEWRENIKTEGDMMDARRDLWQQVEMFRSCDNAGRFPRNSNACVTKYGVCEYLDVCTGRANIDDDSLFRTKESVHEELSV